MVYGAYALIGAVIGGGFVWIIYSIKANKIIDDLRQRLAVSEEKNARIPKLEMTIAQNKTKIAELEADIVSLKDDIAAKAAEIARLNQQLVDERNMAKDKLSMVNDVQGRLSAAMIELSQKAMKCDNAEFMEAMKEHIAQFGQDVLQDIARWQGIETPQAAETDEVIGMGVETPTMDDSDDKSLEAMIAAEVAEQEEAPAEPETGVAAVTELEIAVSESEEEATEAEEATTEAETVETLEAATGEQVEVKVEEEAEAIAVEMAENGDIAVKVEEPAVAEAKSESEDSGDSPIEIETEQVAVVEEAAAAEATEEGENGAEGASNDDIQLAAAADEVAALEKSLDEEISVELDEALREDEGEIKLKDEDGEAPISLDFGGGEAEEKPAFKFEVKEPEAENADNAAGIGVLGDEDGDLKKKLNTESESMQIRKEAG